MIIILVLLFVFVIFIFNKKDNGDILVISRMEELFEQKEKLIPNQLMSLDNVEYREAIKKWGDKRIITIYTKEGDIDGDGISDKQEFLFGTNPFNYDTDDDGKMDSAEIVNGSDPLLAD